jgi:predicted transcriptional regulator
MPFVSKTISNVMVPLAQFPVVKAEDSVREAVRRLAKVFLREHDEAKIRTILVVDDAHHVVGMVSFRKILKSLVPEALGKLSERLRALGLQAAFAESGFEDLAAARAEFSERVVEEASMQVAEIMTKIKRSVQIETPLVEAIRIKYKEDLDVLPVYSGERPVGVLRDVELFLALAEVLGIETELEQEIKAFPSEPVSAQTEISPEPL